jgi:hypothetical protein
MASATNVDSANYLAKQRDAAFAAWERNKSLRDKAIELLGALDNGRAADEVWYGMVWCGVVWCGWLVAAACKSLIRQSSVDRAVERF